MRGKALKVAAAILAAEVVYKSTLRAPIRRALGVEVTHA